MTGKKIGLCYAYLIQYLVTRLGVTFSGVPSDPTDDLLSFDDPTLPSSFAPDIPPTFVPDIPSTSTSAHIPPPTSSSTNTSIAIVSLILIIEQLARNLGDITLLRSKSERHTTDFALLQTDIRSFQMRVRSL